MFSMRLLTMKAVILFLAILVFSSEGMSLRPPDTGQTKCYNDTGSEIPCPAQGEAFYGQDAQYDGPKPTYRDNGDGTISDLNTGLMWQKADSQNNTGRNWSSAKNYCDTSTTGNHLDWRLPSERELFSLVDFGRSDPAINPTYFPDCLASFYWSNDTASLYGMSSAWGVYFDDGTTQDTSQTESNYVRCVRTE